MLISDREPQGLYGSVRAKLGVQVPRRNGYVGEVLPGGGVTRRSGHNHARFAWPGEAQLQPLKGGQVWGAPDERSRLMRNTHLVELFLQASGVAAANNRVCVSAHGKNALPQPLGARGGRKVYKPLRNINSKPVARASYSAARGVLIPASP